VSTFFPRNACEQHNLLFYSRIKATVQITAVTETIRATNKVITAVDAVDA
jgi:hypothetical protein